MKLSSVVVSAVLLLGACASPSVGSGSAPKGGAAPAAGAPAAPVKCERDSTATAGGSASTGSAGSSAPTSARRAGRGRRRSCRGPRLHEEEGRPLDLVRLEAHLEVPADVRDAARPELERDRDGHRAAHAVERELALHLELDGLPALRLGQLRVTLEDDERHAARAQDSLDAGVAVEVAGAELGERHEDDGDDLAAVLDRGLALRGLRLPGHAMQLVDDVVVDRARGGIDGERRRGGGTFSHSGT